MVSRLTSEFLCCFKQLLNVISDLLSKMRQLLFPLIRGLCYQLLDVFEKRLEGSSTVAGGFQNAVKQIMLEDEISRGVKVTH